jgi:hypothetical protein
MIIRSGIDHEFRTTVVKSLCSTEDLQDIAQLVEGCQYYRTQIARLDHKLLDKYLVLENQN